MLLLLSFACFVACKTIPKDTYGSLFVLRASLGPERLINRIAPIYRSFLLLYTKTTAASCAINLARKCCCISSFAFRWDKCNIYMFENSCSSCYVYTLYFFLSRWRVINRVLCLARRIIIFARNYFPLVYDIFFFLK